MAAERVKIPSQVHSDTEYPVSEEDDIRPTGLEEAEEDREWQVIPSARRLTRPATATATATARRSVSAREEERERLRMARKTRKAEKKTEKRKEKEERKTMLRANKYRWTKGEPTVMNQRIVDSVEHAMARFFRPGYETHWKGGEAASEEEMIEFLRSLIRRYKIVVSGGFVLKHISGLEKDLSKPSVDMDMYVAHDIPDRYPDFYETMAKLFLCDVIRAEDGGMEYVIDKYVASEKATRGKGGFFAKNGIYSVYKHSRKVDGIYAEMDIVRPVRGNPPESVVRNFDLSVCMNWYDGVGVFSMHVDAVMRQTPCILNYSYVPTALGLVNEYGTRKKKNPVTRNRILKYLLRGYRVEYLDPTDGVRKEIVVTDLVNAIDRLESRNQQIAVREAYGLSPPPPLKEDSSDSESESDSESDSESESEEKENEEAYQRRMRRMMSAKRWRNLQRKKSAKRRNTPKKGGRVGGANRQRAARDFIVRML